MEIVEGPNVLSVAVDGERGIRYEVQAYRTLTQEELLLAVRYYLSHSRKKPKKGSVVRIVSIIGVND
jgi:hypothetical protein